MYNKKTWLEFRETGLFWFINNILHLFGWVIVIEKVEDNIEVYPARTDFIGFPEKVNKRNLINISQFIQTDIHNLSKEDDHGTN
jgi:hypothetical protein